MPLVETDGSPVTQAVYADLPGMWGRKFSLRHSGASRFYLPDHQGTNGQLADNTQAVTDTLLTDAWGVEVARSGSTVSPFAAFGQWGYYRDAASRLWVRARHLRVDLGAWVSRDPARRRTPRLAYTYARNRPTTAADPTGRVEIIPADLDAWRVGYRPQCWGQVDARWLYWIQGRRGARNPCPKGGNFIRMLQVYLDLHECKPDRLVRHLEATISEPGVLLTRVG